MTEVIRSVYEKQDDILRAIQTLHCPSGFDADVTYGNGAFWRKLPAPALRFDVDPQVDGVTRASFCALPLGDSVLGSIVADPPFLTYVRNGREHKARGVSMSARFGGYYAYADLEESYIGLLREARRVLKPKGRLVFKCQDIIHNHKMHCTHARTIGWAEATGFRLLDLFVLPVKHRMPGPQKGQQRHARIYHSYFLVFERNALAR